VQAPTDPVAAERGTMTITEAFQAAKDNPERVAAVPQKDRERLMWFYTDTGRWGVMDRDGKRGFYDGVAIQPNQIGDGWTTVEIQI